MSRESIFKEIVDERKAQDKEWGGPGHDDNHSSHDWVAYLVKHIGKAIKWPFDYKLYRSQMIRVAALAVAAVEWLDRREEEFKNTNRKTYEDHKALGSS